MSQNFEIVAMRVYFHCGWAIQLDPSFEAEILHGGETLGMFNPDRTREVFLSSMKLEAHSGKPWTLAEVCELFPHDLSGLHYDHQHGDIAGHALWMFGEDDQGREPAWVLLSMVASENAARVARCTIVCSNETDRDWALEVWRSIGRAEHPTQKGMQ